MFCGPSNAFRLVVVSLLLTVALGGSLSQKKKGQKVECFPYLCRCVAVFTCTYTVATLQAGAALNRPCYGPHRRPVHGLIGQSIIQLVCNIAHTARLGALLLAVYSCVVGTNAAGRVLLFLFSTLNELLFAVMCVNFPQTLDPALDYGVKHVQTKAEKDALGQEVRGSLLFGYAV